MEKIFLRVLDLLFKGQQFLILSLQQWELVQKNARNEFLKIWIFAIAKVTPNDLDLLFQGKKMKF